MPLMPNQKCSLRLNLQIYVFPSFGFSAVLDLEEDYIPDDLKEVHCQNKGEIKDYANNDDNFDCNESEEEEDMSKCVEKTNLQELTT
jgi:hypothetical protein